MKQKRYVNETIKNYWGSRVLSTDVFWKKEKKIFVQLDIHERNVWMRQKKMQSEKCLPKKYCYFNVFLHLKKNLPKVLGEINIWTNTIPLRLFTCSESQKGGLKFYYIFQSLYYMFPAEIPNQSIFQGIRIHCLHFYSFRLF